MILTLLYNISNRLYATVQCNSAFGADCILAREVVGRGRTDRNPVAGEGEVDG